MYYETSRPRTPVQERVDRARPSCGWAVRGVGGALRRSGAAKRGAGSALFEAGSLLFEAGGGTGEGSEEFVDVVEAAVVGYREAARAAAAEGEAEDRRSTWPSASPAKAVSSGLSAEASAKAGGGGRDDRSQAGCVSALRRPAGRRADEQPRRAGHSVRGHRPPGHAGHARRGGSAMERTHLDHGRHLCDATSFRLRLSSSSDPCPLHRSTCSVPSSRRIFTKSVNGYRNSGSHRGVGGFRRGREGSGCCSAAGNLRADRQGVALTEQTPRRLPSRWFPIPTAAGGRCGRS